MTAPKDSTWSGGKVPPPGRVEDVFKQPLDAEAEPSLFPATAIAKKKKDALREG